MRTFIALVAMVLQISGCYRTTGQLHVSTSVVPELARTRQETVPVPNRDTVTINHRFDDDLLVVCATRQVACEDREIRTYRRTEVEKRELPWHHWLVLGGGVVLGGTGAYFWADSSGRVNSGESIDIGNRSQEMAYDEGKRDAAIGVGLVIGGGLLLVSEVADLVIARDRERPLTDTSETKTLLRRTCKEKSVGNGLLLACGAGGTQAELRTDSSGCASVDVMSDAMSRIPYAEPFVTVRCEGSSEVVIVLPVPTSARLVAKRKRLAEIDDWLSRNSDSPNAGLVRQARVEVLHAEMETTLLRIDQLLQGKNYDQLGPAFDLANDWLTRYGDEADVDGALRRRTEELTAAAVSNIADDAKALAKSKEHGQALALVDVCLGIEQTAKVCLTLRGSIEAAVERKRRADERARVAAEKKISEWGRKNKGRAKTAARSAVADRLKAPMSANWVSTDVLDYRGNRYVVLVIVDAMNSFGVYLRNSYCVVLSLDMKKRGMYFINEALGVQECNREPTEKEIQMMKALNSWE